jgi:integrase
MKSAGRGACQHPAEIVLRCAADEFARRIRVNDAGVNALQHAVGDEIVREGEVSRDIDGSAVTPSSIRRRHDALLRAAGVPGYLMHEARHTAVSQRARYEQMHVVSRIVGHASPAYTASAYWHAQTGHDRSSVDALAEELRRRRES